MNRRAGRRGDRSRVSADNHGGACCPHDARGPATSGSGNVLINGRAALRVGDRGKHSHCCGAEGWVAVQGAARVLINNRPAHRLDDEDEHCGGSGRLSEASPDVLIGDHVKPGAMQQEHWVGVEVRDAFGRLIPDLEFEVTGPMSFTGTTATAAVKQTRVPAGTYRLRVPALPDLQPITIRGTGSGSAS